MALLLAAAVLVIKQSHWGHPWPKDLCIHREPKPVLPGSPAALVSALSSEK